MSPARPLRPLARACAPSCARSLETTGGAAEPPLPAQPVFTVNLDELLAGGGLPLTATPRWRVSRFEADGASKVMEVTGEGAASVGDDRFSPLIREALGVAAGDQRVQRHDYEARLFRTPALSLLALWLHASGAEDLFVAVGRPPGGLDANRVYPEAAFMAAIRGAAERLAAAFREAEDPDRLG